MPSSTLPSDLPKAHWQWPRPFFALQPMLVTALLTCWVSALAPTGLVQAQTAGSGSAAASSLVLEPSEENLLLLDVVLDRQRLAAGITAHDLGGEIFVSLAEFAAALEFLIEVDAATGIAGGSFLDEGRPFQFDARTGVATVNGVDRSPRTGEVVVTDDQILVSTARLETWFPVRLTYIQDRQQLEVESTEALPIETRAQRRGRASVLNVIGPARLPEIETPHRLVSVPVADVGTTYAIRRDESGNIVSNTLNYSSVFAGDLAGMNARVFIGGNDQRALSNFRFNLRRDDLDLPLGLRSIEFGDVSGTGSGLERGVFIQGGGTVLSDQADLLVDDRIQIAGDGLTGWDVELYQNGLQIGFQTIGVDGRYDFSNIEPLTGENVFELVFYGPGGQTRTEVIRRFSGLTPDLPGSIRYQAYAVEKERPVYDPLSTERSADAGTLKWGLGVDVRVLPRLALRGAINSEVFEGVRRNQRLLGATASIAGANVSLAWREDQFGDTRWEASLGLPLSYGLRARGFDLRFAHTQFATYDSRPIEAAGLDLTSRTSLTASGPVGPLETRLSLSHNRTASSRFNSLGLTVSGRWEDWRVTNSLAYNRYVQGTSDGGNRDTATGSLFVSTAVAPINLRAGVGYELAPDTRVNQYFADAGLQIASDMSIRFGLTHDPVQSLTTYTSGIDWRLPYMILSPRLAYSSNGEYSGFVTAQFSLAPERSLRGIQMNARSFAGGGAVFARVFLDRDQNGEFGPGDEPLPRVRVVAPQAGVRAQTNTDGVAQLVSLGSGRLTDVMVDSSTLPGADLMVRFDGNSIRPRPGNVVELDFPVVRAGVIEGTVTEVRAGARVPAGGVIVEVIDAMGELFESRLTASDGLYVFDAVPLGVYTVRIGGQRSDRAAPRTVTLSDQQPDFTQADFELRANGSAAAPAAQPAPVAAAASPIVQVVDRTPADLAPRSAEAATLPFVTSVPNAPAAATAATPAATAAAFPGSPASLRPGSDGRLMQLGAFSTAENADRALRNLVTQGVLDASAARVLPGRTSSGAPVFRVMASPPTGSAAAACAGMTRRGVNCVAAPMPREG